MERHSAILDTLETFGFFYKSSQISPLHEFVQLLSQFFFHLRRIVGGVDLRIFRGVFQKVNFRVTIAPGAIIAAWAGGDDVGVVSADGINLLSGFCCQLVVRVNLNVLQVIFFVDRGGYRVVELCNVGCVVPNLRHPIANDNIPDVSDLRRSGDVYRALGDVFELDVTITDAVNPWLIPTFVSPSWRYRNV